MQLPPPPTPLSSVYCGKDQLTMSNQQVCVSVCVRGWNRRHPAVNDVHVCNQCLPNSPIKKNQKTYFIICHDEMRGGGPLHIRFIRYVWVGGCEDKPHSVILLPPPFIQTTDFTASSHTFARKTLLLLLLLFSTSFVCPVFRLGSSSPSTTRTPHQPSVSSPRCGTPTFMR